MIKFTAKLFAAALTTFALCFAPKVATAQPVFNGRPALVPLFITQTAVQTTNTATSPIPFVISADHNVNFQFDLLCTNGLGTSNLTVVLDTCLDAQQAPVSWKNAAYVQNVLTPTSNSAAGTTFQFTLSNVPAFYMRVNQLGSAATNVVQITNFYYWPFP